MCSHTIKTLWPRWVLVSLITVLGGAGCGSSQAQRQSVPQSSCESTKEFVFVEGGEYILGSDRAERDYGYRISAQADADRPEQIPQAEQKLRQRQWFEGESPRQVQVLPGVCIRRNLVTNGEYQAFMQATGHRAPGISAADYQTQGFLVHPYSRVKPYLWQGDRYPANQGQHPVVLVSYEDAQAYAQWKGVQEGQTYRLPTEVEWEQTARGKDGRYFPWGNEWQDQATHWAKSPGYGTSAIATYPLSRSPNGVEDMAGNVFEFTSSITQRRGKTVSVMKGCSWDDSPGFCRAAYRHTRPVNSRHILFGFRLVKVE